MLAHRLEYIESPKAHSYEQIISIKLPNVVQSLKVKNDFFHPKEDNKELFDPKVPLFQCH